MHLVKLTNAQKHYCKHIFNLEINLKDVIVVSGENGQGKTTLIELILGYKKPDKGKVEKNKIKIGYLPEESMLPNLVRVCDYLETLAKVKKTKIDEKIIHLFDIPIFKPISQLSKGNKQKLAIISIFIGKPDLVILDEPFSGLDTYSKDRLVDFITEKSNQKMSFLISTHQPKRFSHIMTKALYL